MVPGEKLLKRLKEVTESSSAEGLAASWDPRLPFRMQESECRNLMGSSAEAKQCPQLPQRSLSRGFSLGMSLTEAH